MFRNVQTISEKIIGVSGPASAAMEMAVTNLLWPGRSVLALSMGTFSRRMAEMAEGVGAEVTILESAVSQPVRIEEIHEAFSKKHFDGNSSNSTHLRGHTTSLELAKK